ncbi:unnamed protein product [Lactuca virosa]|uniref:Importin subunit beta-1/Transportin-1-like TPR repeats domain-containing protein n=1 Tax=Lactuca virosa TaxID=75947 RepID=A0AAU9N4Z9_9ASTR|nr:unnamed protein product [Lactuca virosa]
MISIIHEFRHCSYFGKSKSDHQLRTSDPILHERYERRIFTKPANRLNSKKTKIRVTDFGFQLQNSERKCRLANQSVRHSITCEPLFEVKAISKSSSAVLNLSENCTSELLQPYLDGIVGKLLVLLQNPKQMVQEGALTALASVADSSQEHFQKYYDAVMPYLKAILMNATDKANCMLRAKSMECISLVGMAVGKDKFKDDAKQVMDVLMSLQGSQLETDDPTISYMLQAWARLCKCLGQDFLPYMNVVMPPLLHSVQLKPDVTITSADDSDDDIDESDDESIETITLGDKRIGIKTSKGFSHGIDQVAPTLVPHLKFYFHEEVRKAAVSAMPELIRSAKLAVEKGQSQGRNESYVKQLSDYIIRALVEALHKEPETEICSSMIDSIKGCVQICGPLLDENQVRSIVEEIKQVITASSARRNERGERVKSEDFDAEEGEMLEEENKQEEELFDQVGDCLGTLLPLFDELLPYLMPFWGKDRTSEEKRIAICIFDDVAEHCGDVALKYYETFLPLVLEAAVYGVGICAEFGGAAFRPFVNARICMIENCNRTCASAHESDRVVQVVSSQCKFLDL